MTQAVWKRLNSNIPKLIRSQHRRNEMFISQVRGIMPPCGTNFLTDFSQLTFPHSLDPKRKSCRVIGFQFQGVVEKALRLDDNGDYAIDISCQTSTRLFLR
jgi:hypothetical protein